MTDNFEEPAAIVPESELTETMKRVQSDAAQRGLPIEIRRMPASTRTASEAADACGCSVAQIVKSLVFEGENTEELALFLVSGAHPLSEAAAEEAFGEPMRRADPRKVRAETGFAIGGVSPFGHLQPIRTAFDSKLLDYDHVWAAAGGPFVVFSADPAALAKALNASVGMLGDLNARS